MVYSFDESLNEATQTCEMDLIIRYGNNDAQKVDVRYWGSSFFGHATHQDLLKQFNKITSELDPKKLNQISMDGPQINTKFYGEIANNRETSMFHKLLDFGSCNQRIVHAGPATLGGPGGHAPPPPLFCVAKRKKGNKGKQK